MYRYNPQIKQIIDKGDWQEIRSLFAIHDDNEQLLARKYYLWVCTFFPKSLAKKEAEDHKVLVENLSSLYLGNIDTLTETAFRGLGKTSFAKSFIAFCIANDQRPNKRKYFTVNSIDSLNATQFVTDVYNLLVAPACVFYYSELFERKGKKKREETKSSFTTNTGVKMVATSLGQSQRGRNQTDEEGQMARPDFLIFDDFESSKSILSMLESEKIWANMEEAYNAKSADGVALYLCNYITKRRNVHRIIQRAKRKPERHRLHIVPIERNGVPVWEEMYPKELISKLKEDVQDFAGEYNCSPMDSADSYFSEEKLMKHPTLKPILEEDGWTFLMKHDKTHQYLVGVDPSGGTGGNFGTIVVIDYTLRMVCAYYRSRHTPPDELGEKAVDIAIKYNNALIVHETNYQGLVITKIIKDRRYTNVYMESIKDRDTDKETERIGFTTTSKSKPLILSALNTASKDFSLLIPSETIREEMINFPREYVELVKADDEEYGHFDLTMALAIAFEGRTQLMGKLISKGYK